MAVRSFTFGVVLSDESGKMQESCIVVAHDENEAIALATVNYPNLYSELVSVEKVVPIKPISDKPVTINTVITAPDIPACVALIQAGRNGEATPCYSYIVSANNLEEVEIKSEIFATKHRESKWHHVTNIYNTQRIDLRVDSLDLSPILKPYAVKSSFAYWVSIWV